MKDTAIETSLTSMAIFDRDFRLIYANNSCLSEFNLSFNSIQGKMAADIISQFEEIDPPLDEVFSLIKKSREMERRDVRDHAGRGKKSISTHRYDVPLMKQGRFSTPFSPW